MSQRNTLECRLPRFPLLSPFREGMWRHVNRAFARVDTVPCLGPEGSKIRSRSQIGACVGSLESSWSLDSEYTKTLLADLMGRLQNAFKRRVVAFAIVNVRRRHPGNPIVSLSFLISSVQCTGGGRHSSFSEAVIRVKPGVRRRVLLQLWNLEIKSFPTSLRTSHSDSGNRFSTPRARDTNLHIRGTNSRGRPVERSASRATAIATKPTHSSA